MDLEQLQQVAFLARSLSDVNRLRILYCVRNEQKSVSAIVEELGLSQPIKERWPIFKTLPYVE
ncbi:MAG: ArsR family transcriptional regulator [Deltaproteobacteria bacterium]|nr:ArsR family transcriptional regulator [Deltaproteobacteria bacterium]